MNIKNGVSIIIPILVLFGLFQLLFYYKPPLYLFYTLFLCSICFLWIFYVVYKILLTSWKTNLSEIAINYVVVMLVLAMLWSFLYYIAIFGGFGQIYDCNNSTSIIAPSYYFSVSNIFSLSYTDDVCIRGGLMKGMMGMEAIFGNIISIIILAAVINLFFENRSKKDIKRKKRNKLYKNKI
jgi:hypothetical protein